MHPDKHTSKFILSVISCGMQICLYRSQRYNTLFNPPQVVVTTSNNQEETSPYGIPAQGCTKENQASLRLKISIISIELRKSIKIIKLRALNCHQYLKTYIYMYIYIFMANTRPTEFHKSREKYFSSAISVHFLPQNNN